MATLYLICGLPCAGKTTLARRLEAETAAIRFCPDAWILALLADPGDIKERDRLRDPVEQLQWQTAQRLLATGQSVILENGFWVRSERRHYRERAHSLGARVEFHYLAPSLEGLLKRLRLRNAARDPESFPLSEAELLTWSGCFEAPDAAEFAAYDRVEHYG